MARREREGLWGQAFSPIGEKGRVVLPTFARKKIRESSEGRILCLAVDEELKCLTGFGLTRVDGFEAQLQSEQEIAIRTAQQFNRTTRASQLYGFSEVSFDDSGRFILPEHFHKLIDTNGGLYFHGAGELITIWDPARLFSMGEDWSAAKAACETLMEAADARATKK